MFASDGWMFASICAGLILSFRFRLSIWGTKWVWNHEEEEFGENKTEKRRQVSDVFGGSPGLPPRYFLEHLFSDF